MPTWIKLRDDLHTDPRVFAMAQCLADSAAGYVLKMEVRTLFGNVTEAVTCNVLRDVTVAGLARVWAAANQHTQDGSWCGITLDYLDTLAQVPGFGRAMESVGWAVFDAATGAVSLPNFTEYNTPAKGEKRSGSSTRDRVRAFRERQKQQAEKTASDTAPKALNTGSEAVSGNAPVTACNALHETVCNALPSYSVSTSVSVTDSGSESGSASDSQTPTAGSGSGSVPAAAATYPVAGSREGVTELEDFKTRINGLRESWKQMPHWTHGEESALLESLPNLRCLTPDDWARLRRYFTWGHSAANSGKEAHKLTSKRATLLEQLSAYLDRALTHWKQSGRPSLAAAKGSAEGGTGTPARSSHGTTPTPAPSIDPQEAAAAAAHWKSLFPSGSTPSPTPPPVATTPQAA